MSVLSREITIKSQRWEPRPIWIGYIVRSVLGAVLILAAVLKWHYAVTDPFDSGDLFESRVLTMFVANFEVLLGMALIVGKWPRLTIATAACTFGIFFIFSIHAWSRGATTCGCLGEATVPPRVSAAFDVMAVSALLLIASPKYWKTTPAGLSRVIITTAVGACIGSTPTFLVGGASALLGNADLVVDSATHNFGRVSPEEAMSLDHDFRIENRGAVPVSLRTAVSTCSCTVPELPKSPIAPGSYVTVHVLADWRGRKGSQREQVIVSTDSISNPSIALTLVADIVAAAVYWPNKMDFGDVAEGQITQRPIVLAPGRGEPDFDVVSAVSADPQVTLHRVHTDGTSVREHRWTVELSAVTPGPMVETSVRFEMSSGASVVVPTTYRVLPAVRVTPTSVTFLPSESELVKSLVVCSPSEILDIRVVSDTLDASAVRIAQQSKRRMTSGWEYIVTLSYAHPFGESGGAELVITAPPYTSKVAIVAFP